MSPCPSLSKSKYSGDLSKLRARKLPDARRAVDSRPAAFTGQKFGAAGQRKRDEAGILDIVEPKHDVLTPQPHRPSLDMASIILLRLLHMLKRRQRERGCDRSGE